CIATVLLTLSLSLTPTLFPYTTLFRSRLLDQRQAMQDGKRHALIADLEVGQRALRLCAPVRVLRHFDGTQAIGFSTCHAVCSIDGRSSLGCHEREQVPAFLERWELRAQNVSIEGYLLPV